MTIYPWIKLSLVDIPLADLGPAAVASYLVLAANQDDEGFVGMSYRSISLRSGYARRTTIDSIQELESHKLIRRIAGPTPRTPLVCQILSGSTAGSRDMPPPPKVGGD